MQQYKSQGSVEEEYRDCNQASTKITAATTPLQQLHKQ